MMIYSNDDICNVTSQYYDGSYGCIGGSFPKGWALPPRGAKGWGGVFPKEWGGSFPKGCQGVGVLPQGVDPSPWGDKML